jgi:hypothetical protein
MYVRTTGLDVDLMAYCPMHYLTVGTGHHEENNNKKQQSIRQVAHVGQLQNYQQFLPKY